MTVHYAGALDAARTYVRDGSLAEAKWDDICDLLLELGYTLEPKIWYYTLGDYAGVTGLDLDQRKRTTDGRHLFFKVRPGSSRSVEMDQVKTRINNSPLQDAYLADLLTALRAPGHGLVGAVVQAKKFPAAPEVGAFYCPPVEHTVSFDNGAAIRVGNVFWRAGTGTAITGPGGKSTFVPNPEDDPAASQGLRYWLDKQRFATALKQWVKGTSAEKPRLTKERTIESTGTCGICLGNFKMNRRGDLVLHGYKRPGFGWIEGNCSGTGYPPYEISDAACKAFAARLESTLAHVTAQIADFKQALAAGTLESLPDSRNGRWGNRQYYPNVKPGDQRWEIELRNYPRDLEERVKGLNSLITANQKMLKLWTPRPLPGEPGHKSISTIMLDAAREGSFHSKSYRPSISSRASRLVAAEDIDTYRQFRQDLMNAGLWRDGFTSDEKMKAFYSKALARLLSLDGADCWRAMELKDPASALQLSTLGVSWAWKRDAAYSWDAKERFVECVFRARINLDGCHFRDTLFNAYANPDEKEVMFKPGTVLYVYDVEIDGKVYPIGKNRTC